MESTECTHLLKSFTDQERKAINFFFDHLDLVETEKLVEMLANCSGTIIFTGIGKSALVAKKIALTLTSIGVKAITISATDAMHGDLGIAREEDILLIFSKSGESDELLHLIPVIRNKGVKIGAIVSNPQSRIAKAADFVLTLPLEKELCPFNLAPTTSSVIQMILGDLLTVALMEKKRLTLDEYAMNHPAGQIGKRITLRVKDLMLKRPHIPLCSPDDKIVDILVELSDKRCGCILVCDEGEKFLGIFTDGDLRRSLQKLGDKALNTSVSELMTKNARSIYQETLATEALIAMESDQKHPITTLAVVDLNCSILGLIKMHDILQAGI